MENKNIEVQIVDDKINDTVYKLAKIYKNGRVYACHFNLPELTKDKVLLDYAFYPRDFRPFNESTNQYIQFNPCHSPASLTRDQTE